MAGLFTSLRERERVRERERGGGGGGGGGRREEGEDGMEKECEEHFVIYLWL